jgi:hypothetical protein
VHKKRNDRTDQEHDEQYLGDAGGARCYSTEAENRGNQRDHKKHNGVMKHLRILVPLTIVHDDDLGGGNF